MRTACWWELLIALIVCSMQKRLKWIDAVKGIGIILVLIGHCQIKGVNEYLYFHMPLFYIISGYCWNEKKYSEIEFKPYFVMKFKSYIIPYLKISGWSFLFFGILFQLWDKGFTEEYLEQILKYIFGILIYSRGDTEWLPKCSPLWFLTTLFFAEVFFYLLKKTKYCLLYVILVGFIGYLCSLLGKYFPWNIDNACTAIPFLYIGFSLKKMDLCNRKKNLVFFPIIILLSFYALKCGNNGVDFDGNSFSNILLTHCGSIVVVLTLMAICRILQFYGMLVVLPWFGKYTLLLFGYNYAINFFVHGMGLYNSWAMAVMVIALGVVLIKFTNKYSNIKKIII